MQASILIVEDEKDISSVLRDILESEGYQIFCAGNGKEALERLDQIPTPNMILLDLLMPVMNGIEFRAAQLKNPRLAKIPILVMTADKSSAAQLGEAQLSCLKKPIDIVDLVETIEKHARPTG